MVFLLILIYRKCCSLYIRFAFFFFQFFYIIFTFYLLRNFIYCFANGSLALRAHFARASRSLRSGFALASRVLCGFWVLASLGGFLRFAVIISKVHFSFDLLQIGLPSVVHFVPFGGSGRSCLPPLHRRSPGSVQSVSLKKGKPPSLAWLLLISHAHSLARRGELW